MCKFRLRILFVPARSRHLVISNRTGWPPQPGTMDLIFHGFRPGEIVFFKVDNAGEFLGLQSLSWSGNTEVDRYAV